MGPPVALAPIALQPDSDAVLETAVAVAHDVAKTDSAFVAVPGVDGGYPVPIRLGLSDPAWARVSIRAGCGLGGLSLIDHLPRTTHNYLQDASITGDYVPIMRREELRGLAVVPIRELGRPGGGAPAGLLYVSTRTGGAPGDRVVDELQRVAEMAAVGLAHLKSEATPSGAGMAGLSPREFEILVLLSEGDSNREIARRLFIAEATVKGHVRAILRKLEAPSRLAAVAIARRRCIL
jgi:DNA-binding CsgD family transcriptional regulator